jgi:hypothetical protein
MNNVWSLLTLEDERDLVRRQAYQSWTSLDLDVLLRKGTLVLLTGDARYIFFERNTDTACYRKRQVHIL